MNLSELERELHKIEDFARANLGKVIHQKLVMMFRDVCVKLGYEGPLALAVDERQVSPDRPDVKAFDELGSSPLAIEVKNPNESIGLKPNRKIFEAQLRKYVDPSKTTAPPELIVLSDGVQAFAYSARQSRLGKPKRFARLEQCAPLLYDSRREALEIYNPTVIQQRLSPPNPAALSNPETIRSFCEEFGLSQKAGPFAEILQATIQLFRELRQHSAFLQGAYSWWSAHYFSETETVPRQWHPYIPDEEFSSDGRNEGVRILMFCLETAYTLLARFIFFKALRDHRLEDVDSLVVANIRPSDTTYVALTRLLMETYQKGEVENIFEADIFDWWTDALAVPATLQAVRRFDRAIARLLLSIWRYDFKTLQGDLVGELYQIYFDREIRKALGEFYTPEEVVDFILTHIGYSSDRFIPVTGGRLLDPACGSGTFLVKALRVYLDAHKNKVHAVRKLFTSFPIVGFDIHPFACLMSQLNFLLTILPFYARARQSSSFRPKRLPIFRTDTLWKEPAAWNDTLDRTVEADVVVADISLPVLVKEETFARIRVELPTPEAFRRATGLAEPKYVAFLIALFTALKRFERSSAQPPYDALVRQVAKRIEAKYSKRFGRDTLYTDTQREGAHAFRQMIDETWGALAEESKGLHEEIESTLRESLEDDGFETAEILARQFSSVAGKILVNIRLLRNEFGDGRYLKAVEDYAIATVLKHYVKYDFVVANPPYVRIQKLQHLSGYLSHYEEVAKYSSLHGAYDISVLFIERGMEFLSLNGRLGYITSNMFMKTNYGEAIRREISKRSESGSLSVSTILDMGYTHVFEDVMNHPCLLFLTRGINQKPLPTLAARVTAANRSVLPKIEGAIRGLLGDEYYLDSKNEFDLFAVESERLSGNPWVLLPRDEQDIADHMRQVGRPLHQHAALVGLSEEDVGFEGPRTGSNEVFYVSKVGDIGVDPNTGKRLWKVVSEMSRGADFELEADLLKPVLQGREVGKWRAGKGWQDVFVIFPYRSFIRDTGSSQVELIDEETMTREYPKAWSWFNQPEVKERLEQREDGRWKGKRDWYGFARPQNLALMFQTKILSPDVSPQNRFAFDADGAWCIISGFGISLPSVSPKVKHFILGQLNSGVLEFFAKAHAEVRAQKTITGGTTYNNKYDKGLLTKLPLMEYDSENPSHDEIASLARELTLVGARRFPEDYIHGDSTPLSVLVEIPTDIQANLSDAELRNVFHQFQETVNGECLVGLGRSTLTIPSSGLAQYVWAWLDSNAEINPQSDRRVTSAALNRVMVPKGDNEMRTAYEEYQETMSRLSELQNRLDSIVATAYGLDRGDFAESFRRLHGRTPSDVLRRFLSRF